MKSKERTTKIILDSGAFSVWTKKKQINIDHYIQFIKENRHMIDYAVALDVLPGAPNQKLSFEDRQVAARASRRNYIYMLKKGVPADILIPVYHQGEEEIWLEKMARECNYIGISPANDKTTAQRKMWLKNTCAPYLFNADGSPKIKFHGFAVTSFDLLTSFSWYSVDSATWLQGSISGFIYVPKYQSTALPPFDFSLMWQVFMGKKTPAQKHISNITEKKRQVVLKWVESCGGCLQKCADEYKERNFVNFNYLIGMREQIQRTHIYFAGAEGFASHIHIDKRPTVLEKKPSFLLTYAQINKTKQLEKITNILKGENNENK